MSKEVKALYTCGEAELYSIADLLYNNLSEDLTAFAAKNTKYTTTFLAALRLSREQASALPDASQRKELHMVLRNKLKDVYLPAVLDNFNDLKGYIRDAWPDEITKPRYEEAGQKYYVPAMKMNWEYVDGLNNSMKRFIAVAENAAKLASPGGMPAGFSAKVLLDETNFSDTYGKFEQARETGRAQAAKVKANNKLYSEMMRVIEDGSQMVFRNDSGRKKRYTFKVLRNLVSPVRRKRVKKLRIADS